jgi:hypothetical protein
VRNLLILLVLGVLLLQTGCQTDPFRKATVPEVGPTALDAEQFDDIPVPRGFRLDSSRSYSYRSGELRKGEFYYSGTRLTPAQALGHYQAEMVRPIYGWSITEISEGDGSLAFLKGRDRVVVRCEKMGESTRVSVIVNGGEDAPRTEE